MIRLLPGDCLDVLPTLPADSIDAVVTDPPYLLEFMGKSWDRPDAAPVGVTPFEAWFAGFAAGEGCFRVQSHKERKYFTCTFSIHLRADDVPVLRGLQQRIGGRIVLGNSRTNRQGITSSPDARWLVETRDGCWAVAKILDRMPLFAKKAADYALWRRALQIWTDTPRGNRWHGPRDVGEMASIMEALQTVKRYSGDIAPLDFDPFMPPAQAFHYKWAREVYRVMKPGAHLVAFGGTRTSHRMVCAIEDAGFEIRDTLCWLYGTGYPKSLNAERAIAINTCVLPGRHYANNLPPEDKRKPGDHICPATEESKPWDGWGTALKPSWENIVLARKPLAERTVAANVLRYGTGAINVDACKIGTTRSVPASLSHSKSSSVLRLGVSCGTERDLDPNMGRWPANLCHDGSDEVEAAFAEFGTSTTGVRSDRSRNADVAGTKWLMANYKSQEYPGDTGTASRFFTRCAFSPDELRFHYSGKADTDDRAGSSHPTIKPVALMRWLVRLITPPGGTILDPFAGTGTTGEAAMLEEVNAILIERDPQHVDDIQHRIRRWSGLDAPLFAERVA